MIELPLPRGAGTIRTVAVEFANDLAVRTDGVLLCDRNLFVDWIEVGDRLFAAADADQVDRCPTRERPGQLYCSGTLHFDLTKPGKVPNAQAMSMGLAMEESMAAPARADWERVLAARPVVRSLEDWVAALPGPLRRGPDVWRGLGPVAPVVVVEKDTPAAEAVRRFVGDLSYQLR